MRNVLALILMALCFISGLACSHAHDTEPERHSFKGRWMVMIADDFERGVSHKEYFLALSDPPGKTLKIETQKDLSQFRPGAEVTLEGIEKDGKLVI